MNYITPADLKAQLEENTVFLLDIREPYEVEICSIGGVHIPMAEVASRLDEIRTELTIAVLCRSGKRAEAVGNFLLTECELKNIAIVQGGILGWIESIDNSLETY